jgi:1A family penicillin-binding protein
MSRTGKPRGRLTADKRYTTPQPARKKPKPARKPAAKKRVVRKPARRKPVKKSLFGRIAGFFLGIIRWIFTILWRIGWRVTAVITLLTASGVGYYYNTLPPVSELVDGRIRGSVTLMDRNGKVFAWRGDQYGGMITATSVSPYLKNAVVATEDKRFYSHFGISPRGVASAIKINIAAGRGPLSGNGGSTITQQTAKLLCLGVPFDYNSGQTEAQYEAKCRTGSLWRKIKEATYALALETRYTKDEILTIYLNRAFLGAGARGFEAASQRYFGRSAKDVTPAQAAMMAGLLKAPTRFAPTNKLQRAQDRAATVIKLMEEQGYLTSAQAAHARQNPATLSPAARARAGGYFADLVMRSGPSFLTSETTEDVIIRTTLDPRVQKAAEEALQFIFENKVREGSEAQAAIIVMSSDGAVRAMVGGRDIKASGGFNRATQALRQTGSTFKPFVFAAALDLGYSPNDFILDGPLTLDIPGSGLWSPKNYGDHYYGRVTLTRALTKSLNTATVRVSESVGRENVRTIAEGFGIRSNLADGPAVALGVSESTLIETTGAYAGILNGGSAVTPYGLVELKLQGDSNALMRQQGGMGERVISQQAAAGLIYMMNNVIVNGTGKRAAIDGIEIAGKTGTTQEARDAWFIGFSADYVAGVWMGYDDNTPLKGVTGGGLPAEIWRETMTRVLKDQPVRPLPMTKPAKAAPPPTPAPAAPQKPGRTPKKDTLAEKLLLDVLDKFLGGSN